MNSLLPLTCHMLGPVIILDIKTGSLQSATHVLNILILTLLRMKY
jgi:hypothetical protein